MRHAYDRRIVQDPREAQFPSMPTHGIVHDDVDAVFTVRQISHALIALSRGHTVASSAEDTMAVEAV